MITKAIRELDRERVRLQTSEKRLIADIRTAAKKDQIVCVKTQIRPTNSG